MVLSLIGSALATIFGAWAALLWPIFWYSFLSSLVLFGAYTLYKSL